MRRTKTSTELQAITMSEQDTPASNTGCGLLDFLRDIRATVINWPTDFGGSTRHEQAWLRRIDLAIGEAQGHGCEAATAYCGATFDADGGRLMRGPEGLYDPAQCQHKPSEDCMICRDCGDCREDLDSTDLCMDCGGEDEAAGEEKTT